MTRPIVRRRQLPCRSPTIGVHVRANSEPSRRRQRSGCARVYSPQPWCHRIKAWGLARSEGRRILINS
eukprot:gene22482-26966_t